MIILIITFLIWDLVGNSCKNWEKGLKKTEIDNKNYSCLIKNSGFCSYDIFDNIFDMERIFKSDCKKENREGYFIENMEENEIYGFPRTEN